MIQSRFDVVSFSLVASYNSVLVGFLFAFAGELLSIFIDFLWPVRYRLRARMVSAGNFQLYVQSTIFFNVYYSSSNGNNSNNIATILWPNELRTWWINGTRACNLINLCAHAHTICNIGAWFDDRNYYISMIFKIDGDLNTMQCIRNAWLCSCMTLDPDNSDPKMFESSFWLVWQRHLEFQLEFRRVMWFYRIFSYTP